MDQKDFLGENSDIYLIFKFRIICFCCLKRNKGTGACSSMVEHLPSKYNVMSLICSTVKSKKKTFEQKMKRQNTLQHKSPNCIPFGKTVHINNVKKFVFQNA